MGLRSDKPYLELFLGDQLLADSLGGVCSPQDELLFAEFRNVSQILFNNFLDHVPGTKIYAGYRSERITLRNIQGYVMGLTKFEPNQ